MHLYKPLMDDYMRQEAGLLEPLLLRQQELGGIATGMGLEQAGFATQQRMIGLSQPISKPSFLSGALGVASGALSGARTGLTLKGMMGGGSSVDTSLNIPKDLAAQYGYQKIR